MENKDYQIFSAGNWGPLSYTHSRKELFRDTRWSARISTGVFGMTNCSPGNKGPKGKKEVLLADGSEGLLELIDLGFIPCSVCHPEEKEEGFFDIIEDKVKSMYGLRLSEDFCDKQKLPFDARRLDWERIANIAWGLPGRIYVPEKLSATEIQEFAACLKNVQSSSLNSSIPPIGFYDRNSPTRFTEYKLE